MWFAKMNFPVIFISSILLNFQGFVKCDVNCHEEDSDEFNQKALNETNYYRQLHSAEPLQLNKELIKQATNWSKSQAEEKKFTHTPSEILDDLDEGENLAIRQGGSPDWNFVQAWYNESALYSYDNKFHSTTGHFTQLVWKGTKELGCAICTETDKNGHFITCRYRPAGNIEGQFAENVLKPKEKPEEKPKEKPKEPSHSPEDLSGEETATKGPKTGGDTTQSPRSTPILNTVMSVLIYLVAGVCIVPIVMLLIIIIR